MTVIRTQRLVLRPARLEDADRFTEILSNWNVMKMVRLAPHPYTPAHAHEWIGTHEGEREAGTAFRFVVEREGRMIGACDVDEIASESGDLGYWLDEAAWGRGIATEAVQAVVAFSVDDVHLVRLTSGLVADNLESGGVLTDEENGELFRLRPKAQ